MPRMIYFLKANAIAVGPLGERVIPFVYAERVEREGTKLKAVNAQVPAPEWKDGELQLRGRRLPDSVFCGFAYKMPAPPWFDFGRHPTSDAR